MPKVVDWQDEKIKNILLQLFDVYLTSPKWGVSYKIEKLFYEKTGKRINYITIREKMRNVQNEVLKNK